MRGQREPGGLKVGIFGGTFNPIHFGHLRSAEEVREEFSLDRVYFVPAASPPHKSHQRLATAKHRFNMTKLAVENNPFFCVSTVELERKGPSYSVDTIRQFLADLPSSSLFFIIGLDAFREIHTWKDYLTLLALCNFIVTSRPGAAFPTDEIWIPVALRKGLCYHPTTRMYQHLYGRYLTLHKIQGLHISASQVRNTALQGKSIRYLVPRNVQEYIVTHNLYR